MKPIVLVIEDDQALCWLIEKFLSRDFTVSIKREGITAMEWLLEGNIPDLILCDYNIPKINGLEFLQNLTKSGAFKGIPFVMSSSFIDKTLNDKFLEAGAHTVLKKPFDPPKLIEVIKDIVKVENVLNKNV